MAPGRKMTRAAGISIAALAAAAGLFVLGFVLFAATVVRAPTEEPPNADGIVVLTGGEQRLLEGARLLAEKRAGRMLVTGVNRRTGRDDLHRLSQLDAETFQCCVDLGYQALDTGGNADETRTWADLNHFRRLIVVTASYHMPRSLAELKLALPEAELIPHPVVPKSFKVRGWWLHAGTARVLVAEYLKLLPTAARLAAARMVGGHWANGGVAQAARQRPEFR